MVVPSKVTVVPSDKSVMSSVSPAVTAMPLRMMSVQSALPETAELRSVKVQLDEAVASVTSPVDATEADELTAADDTTAVVGETSTVEAATLTTLLALKVNAPVPDGYGAPVPVG